MGLYSQMSTRTVYFLHDTVGIPEDNISVAILGGIRVPHMGYMPYMACTGFFICEIWSIGTIKVKGQPDQITVKQDLIQLKFISWQGKINLIHQK